MLHAQNIGCADNFLRESWPGNSTMICNVKMKNGDCSGDLGTKNYCKDTTLVSIVITIKAFGSLDTQDQAIRWQGQPYQI